MRPVDARQLALRTKWSEGMKCRYAYRHGDYYLGGYGQSSTPCVSVVRLLFRPQK